MNKCALVEYVCVRQTNRKKKRISASVPIYRKLFYVNEREREIEKCVRKGECVCVSLRVSEREREHIRRYKRSWPRTV